MLADRSTAEPLFAQAARRAAQLGRPVLASWTRPSTIHDAIGFFDRAAATEDRVLWLRPDSGEALVGLGAAHVLEGSGVDRLAPVSQGWHTLLADAVIDAPAEAAADGLLLVGGFRFDPRRPPVEEWKAFTGATDARFVLPQQVLRVSDGRAWLTTNLVAAAPASATSPSQLSTPGPPPEVPGPQPVLSPTAWKALVGSVARGIRHGQLGLEKVVLARAVHVQQAQPIDPVAALRQLAATYPSCTIFAVAHGQACFLGATPERLIALHNGVAATMALAGSIARGATPAADQALADRLRRDPKERAEHAVVVGALRAGMSQVCTRVIADAQPRLQKLPNLQHLLTRIRGQVPAGRGVLDLVEQLHPTPAMGGFPRQRALELIRAHEHLDRGWYAAPIGWVDRHDEGEFVVGIRSALVQGARATLFAGCGIVGESNPAAEYTEASWKLRPILTALGLPEAGGQ